MADELQAVLRLVAEGRLTPEEAAPIVDALSRARDADRGPRPARTGPAAFAQALGARLEDEVASEVEGSGPGGRRGGRQLRIRVTERGRQVVNLRIPIGFVDSALHFVPGLGGDDATRIRDAVRAGTVGPIIDVEDEDGGGVLITVE